MAKVLLLYNAPVLPASHPDAESERDVLQTVDAVALALSAHQHEVTRLGLTDSPTAFLESVHKHHPEVIFNLFEGLGDRPASEYHLAGMIEWLRIPYTGCPLEAMVLGRDKIRSKYLFQGAGLPTAEFHVASLANEVPVIQQWPVMVKPSATDASIGIEQGSVVHDPQELLARVQWVIERYQMPAILETYLPGTEYNVGVVDVPHRMVLPIAEMVYTPQQGVKWPIVSYASKWEPGSAEDLAMQPRCPADIDAALQQQLKEVSIQAFELLGCKDYARVDLRLDGQGKPHILEVNPNPDLGSSAGLSRMLRTAGIDYADFIHQLVLNHLHT